MLQMSLDRPARLSGKSAQGAKWDVVINDGTRDGVCFWALRDMDRNGFVDFILLSGNAGSGPEGLTVTTVFFDADGRPIPWQATGAFDLRDDGIGNLQSDRITGEIRMQKPVIVTRQEQDGWEVAYQIYVLRDQFWYKSRSTEEQEIKEGSRSPDPGEEDLVNAPRRGFGARATLRSRDWNRCASVVGSKGIEVDTEISQDMLDCFRVFQGAGSEYPMIEILDRIDGSRFAAVDVSLAPVIGDKRVDVIWQWIGQSCAGDCEPFIAWYRETK
jgi:hypothetical protein